jgi:hypothetical protein
MQPILVFAIGVVAIVTVIAAWFTVFPTASNSLTYLVYAVVYLFFGLIVGLLWRSHSVYGGIWLALPLVLFGIVSILFAGFGSKFVSDDLPRLATAFLAGTIGCYLGRRVRSDTAIKELN